MKHFFSSLLALSATTVLSLALSGASQASGLTDEEREHLLSQVRKTFNEVEISDISPAPVSGFFQVAVGAQIYYVSRDGAYLFAGNLVEIDTRTNLTEQTRFGLIRETIEEVGEKQMLVIGPEDATSYVTVFTDVDCPYCNKFHLDVPALNHAGVKVRYLMFPRTGIDSRSYERAVGVWCSDDPAKWIGIAKAGGEVEPRVCENPVASHYELGLSVGIRGTPSIILESGEMIAGYVPPQRLLQELGITPE